MPFSGISNSGEPELLVVNKPLSNHLESGFRVLPCNGANSEEGVGGDRSPRIQPAGGTDKTISKAFLPAKFSFPGLPSRLPPRLASQILE
jgi:hypothetical protein